MAQNHLPDMTSEVEADMRALVAKLLFDRLRQFGEKEKPFRNVEALNTETDNRLMLRKFKEKFGKEMRQFKIQISDIHPEIANKIPFEWRFIDNSRTALCIYIALKCASQRIDSAKLELIKRLCFELDLESPLTAKLTFDESVFLLRGFVWILRRCDHAPTRLHVATITANLIPDSVLNNEMFRYKILLNSNVDITGALQKSADYITSFPHVIYPSLLNDPTQYLISNFAAYAFRRFTCSLPLREPMKVTPDGFSARFNADLYNKKMPSLYVSPVNVRQTKTFYFEVLCLTDATLQFGLTVKNEGKICSSSETLFVNFSKSDILGCLCQPGGEYSTVFISRNGQIIEKKEKCFASHFTFHASARILRGHCYINLGQVPFQYQPDNIELDEMVTKEMVQKKVITPSTNADEFENDYTLLNSYQFLRPFIPEYDGDYDWLESELLQLENEMYRSSLKRIQQYIRWFSEEEKIIEIFIEYMGKLTVKNDLWAMWIEIWLSRRLKIKEEYFPNYGIQFLLKCVPTDGVQLCNWCILFSIVTNYRRLETNANQSDCSNLTDRLIEIFKSTTDDWTSLFALKTLTNLKLSDTVNVQLKETIDLWIKKYNNEFGDKNIVHLLTAKPTDFALKYQILLMALQLVGKHEESWSTEEMIVSEAVCKVTEKVNYYEDKEAAEFNYNTDLMPGCPLHHLQSVPCTTSNGIYYYEAIVLTSGSMRIGWNANGVGTNEDEDSYQYFIQYNGYKRTVKQSYCTNTNFKNGTQFHQHYRKYSVKNVPPWQVGDVVCCAIDITNQQFSFYLNGIQLVLTKCVSPNAYVPFGAPVRNGHSFGNDFFILIPIKCCLNVIFPQVPYRASVILAPSQQCYLNLDRQTLRYADCIGVHYSTVLNCTALQVPNQHTQCYSDLQKCNESLLNCAQMPFGEWYYYHNFAPYGQNFKASLQHHEKQLSENELTLSPNPLELAPNATSVTDSPFVSQSSPFESTPNVMFNDDQICQPSTSTQHYNDSNAVLIELMPLPADESTEFNNNLSAVTNEDGDRMQLEPVNTPANPIPESSPFTSLPPTSQHFNDNSADQSTAPTSWEDEIDLSDLFELTEEDFSEVTTDLIAANIDVDSIMQEEQANTAVSHESQSFQFISPQSTSSHQHQQEMPTSNSFTDPPLDAFITDDEFAFESNFDATINTIYETVNPIEPPPSPLSELLNSIIITENNSNEPISSSFGNNLVSYINQFDPSVSQEVPTSNSFTDPPLD